MFKRTWREWEKSTDGGVGGVSVSFVGREGEKERERERKSLPAFTQCDRRRLFLFTAVTMQWAPFLSSLRNCSPCQSNEVEMKAGYIKACSLLCLTRLIIKVLNAASIIVLAEFMVQNQGMSSMNSHTQSPPQVYMLAVYCASLNSEHMVDNVPAARRGSNAKCDILGITLLHFLAKSLRSFIPLSCLYGKYEATTCNWLAERHTWLFLKPAPDLTHQMVCFTKQERSC